MAKNGRQGEGGGRPTRVITSEEIIQIEALAAYLSREQIADFLGIGRTTFYEIMQRQPEVYEQLLKGKSKAIGNVAKSLIRQAIDGNIQAAKFYLQTQAGWRENAPEPEVDQTSKSFTIQLVEAKKPE